MRLQTESRRSRRRGKVQDGLRAGLPGDRQAQVPSESARSEAGMKAPLGKGSSQDVPAEVLVLNDIGQLFLDVGGVHAHVLLLQIRAFERDLIRSFSMIVWRRRAPIFSVWSLTVAANRAISSSASSVKDSLIPSVSSSPVYCLTRALFGSFRMRMKSSTVRDL